MCTPVGIECYQSIKEEKGKCLTPCKGVFTDVSDVTEYRRVLPTENFMKVDEMANFNKKILEIYKDYKTGFKNEKKYAKKIAGI